MASTRSTCAFKPCACTIGSKGSVQYQGRTYCSARCVDGRGCDHARCNCGAFPTAEPELDVVLAGSRAMEPQRPQGSR